MLFRHYSSLPQHTLRSVDFSKLFPNLSSMFNKPRFGIWARELTGGRSFWDCFTNTRVYTSYVDIEMDMSKVLILDSDNVVKFGKVYQKDYGDRVTNEAYKSIIPGEIDWYELAKSEKEYSAVYLQPDFYHQLNMESFTMFKSWDVPSICIWNINCIKSQKWGVIQSNS